MRISRERRRLLAAVVATAAAGGLAAGLVVSHDHSDRALAGGAPEVLAQGAFRTVTWNTSGAASLVREPSGGLKLRLSSSFTTKSAPEIFLYLVKFNGRRRTVWREVGSLRKIQGRQEYRLPDDVAKLRGVSVAIVCGECNKISALALLKPVHGSAPS